MENTGSLVAEDVEARLILPPGIDFVGRERSSKPLGNIPPRKSVEVTWTLVGKEFGDYKVKEESGPAVLRLDVRLVPRSRRLR